MAIPVPEGMHTVTPHLAVRGASKAIEFYKRAFGAQEVLRMPGPGDSVMHAEVRIGDSVVFVADEFPGSPVQSPPSLRGTTAVLNLYVPDVDALFNQAVGAGAKVVMPVGDQFWGDRYGQVADPYGHVWAIASHVEDVPPDEMMRRSEAFMAQMEAHMREQAAQQQAAQRRRAAAARKTAKKTPARKSAKKARKAATKKASARKAPARKAGRRAAKKSPRRTAKGRTASGRRRR